MKRALIAILLAASGGAQATDFEEAWQKAQDYDAAYAAAKANLAAGQEKLPQGRAGLLPTISASANTVWNRNTYDYDAAANQTTLLSGTKNYNSNGYGITASQPILRLANWAQYRQAEKQVSQAELQFSLARQNLLLKVAGAYFDVLQAKDNLEVVRAQKKAYGEQLAQAKRNFEVGTATIVDTHDAQARYDLTNAQEIAALNDLEVKNRRLAQIIGPEAKGLIGLETALPLESPDPATLDAWTADAREHNLGVAISRLSVDIAGEQIKKMRAGHYPTLDAVATYADARQANSNFGIGIDVATRTVGLQLAIPIYQGGLVSSQVREAVAQLDAARNNLEDTARQAVLAAEQSYLGVTNGIAQVKALEQALVSSQSSLESTKLGQEVGVRTEVDVLNAEQQFATTRKDLSAARYQYILSMLQLKAAVGALDDRDVERVNQWLEKY